MDLELLMKINKLKQLNIYEKHLKILKCINMVNIQYLEMLVKRVY